MFHYDVMVYLSIALFIAVQWFLTKSRSGLTLRAIGESPAVAHAIGKSVLKTRYLAVTFGGATAGIAGAYLSLVQTPMWVEGMSAGKGLDCARARRVRNVEADACCHRRLSVRWRDPIPAFRSRVRSADPHRVSVDAALCSDDYRSGNHLSRSQDDLAEPTRLSRPQLPLDRLRTGGRYLSTSLINKSLAGLFYLPQSFSSPNQKVSVMKLSKTLKSLPLCVAVGLMAMAPAGAFAADPLKVAFVYLGPRRRRRLDATA